MVALDRGDARGAQFGDLGVGECAVGGEETQGEREAYVVGAELIGAIHVEESHRLNQLAARGA